MATPNMLALNSMLPGVLVSTKIAVTTDSAVYTVPANKAVKLAQGSISNISGAAVTFGLSIVQSGGTVGDGTHKIIPDGYSLAADFWSAAKEDAPTVVVNSAMAVPRRYYRAFASFLAAQDTLGGGGILRIPQAAAAISFLIKNDALPTRTLSAARPTAPP